MSEPLGGTDTLPPPSAAPRPYRTTLTACLKANPPPAGQSRDNWYLYDVVFDGETIVANSKDAECEAARVLLARGITGKLTMLDAATKRPTSPAVTPPGMQYKPAGTNASATPEIYPKQVPHLVVRRLRLRFLRLGIPRTARCR